MWGNKDHENWKDELGKVNPDDGDGVVDDCDDGCLKSGGKNRRRRRGGWSGLDGR